MVLKHFNENPVSVMTTKVRVEFGSCDIGHVTLENGVSTYLVFMTCPLLMVMF
jgi:hypothetical protein